MNGRFRLIRYNRFFIFKNATNLGPCRKEPRDSLRVRRHLRERLKDKEKNQRTDTKTKQRPRTGVSQD